MRKLLKNMSKEELWDEGKRLLDAFGEVLEEQELREKETVVRQHTGGAI